MITVAGFNTAIDRGIDVGTLRAGEVQRATAVHVRPGGKGLHVAQTVAALGESVQLVGLDDAAHADLLAGHLRARRVAWHPVRATHALRQCLALREADGRITEILEAGEAVAEPVRQRLLDQVLSLLDTSAALVLSGSLPPGFPADTYATLARESRTRGVPCLIDASGSALKLAVRACPWLVKPNVDEAATLLGRRPTGIDDAVECARALQRAGVRRPVVTLGALGAVAIEEGSVWRASTDGVKARNPVGSGDCFLAAMAVAAARGDAVDASLRLAAACGAANAENEETGFATLDQVQAWLPRVRLERLPVPPSVATAPARPAAPGA